LVDFGDGGDLGVEERGDEKSWTGHW
jgi:hypothetical protein